MSDLISKTTRRAFQESYVNFAVIRLIETDFDDAGVKQGEIPAGKFVSGERRSLVEEYYAAIDWSSHKQVRRVLSAYESHLLRLEERGVTDEVKRLTRHLARDGVRYEEGRLIIGPGQEELDDLVDEGMTVDLSQLRINISRIRDAIEDDPALAIGSSKELVEATCKAILSEKGVSFPSNADIPELVRLVSDHLKLLASNVSEGLKGAHSIRRVLGSLANIVQGLAELRNLYGSGHGRAPERKGLSARHARLCAGAASALAMFLMETAKERDDT